MSHKGIISLHVKLIQQIKNTGNIKFYRDVKDKDAVPIIIVYGRHSPMRRQVFPCIRDLRDNMMRADRSDTAWHSKSPVDSYWKKEGGGKEKEQQLL